MIVSKKLYKETLSLCAITERVGFTQEPERTPNAFTSEITHQLIEDSILLKNSIYSALTDHASLSKHYSMLRFALILAKNLQSYIRGLERDHSVNREYLKVSRRALRLYRRLLLNNYNQWKVQLN
jgi:hypothetical protein